MKVTLLGVMHSCLDQNSGVVSNDNAPLFLEDLKRLAGAEAGICYMSDKFFDSYVSDPDKALKRFEIVATTGHHSIAGHAQVALLLEDVPKIVAMYLNNLHAYEASEKSGRYTVMTGVSDIEMEMYEKWMGVLTELITKKYGNKIDPKTIDKLAKENARYFLSVFTPTTIGYTTSLRQWNYILSWIDRFCFRDAHPKCDFYGKLMNSFEELQRQLTPLIGVNELLDHKNRQGLDMIKPQAGLPSEGVIGEMYSVNYVGSFAQFAQAQRHRTLNYEMFFDGISQNFYLPPIMKDAGRDLSEEWMLDMAKVAHVVPQGTLVTIHESGKVEDFYLKSMERNCGRAQLEIMRQTIKTAAFLENREIDLNFLSRYYDRFSCESMMKGQLIKCKEPCVWGCEGAKTRLI